MNRKTVFLMGLLGLVFALPASAAFHAIKPENPMVTHGPTAFELVQRGRALFLEFNVHQAGWRLDTRYPLLAEVLTDASLTVTPRMVMQRQFRSQNSRIPIKVRNMARGRAYELIVKAAYRACNRSGKCFKERSFSTFELKP